MTTSEPTTGELVSALRTCNNRKGERCSQCPVFSKYGYPRTCKRTVDLRAADRLESQECEIERLQKTIDRQDAVCYALTARAEQAEAREKAAVADMHGYCQFCGGYDREEDEEPCNTCTNARTFEPDDVERTDNWEYRGQPQEGEGL